MRALAVVTPSFYEKVDDTNRYKIKIDDLEIPLAFVEGNDPDFDADSDQYANLVLVKKTSFSLNYRDLGIMERAWDRLKAVAEDTFYLIGSDFAGHVTAIGKNVKTLKIDDLVIVNGFFPMSENGAAPGVPSNHASKEFEVYHFAKLLKVPDYISDTEAGTLCIGIQTANAMVRKAGIQKGENVLVTSVTSNTSFFLLNALWEMDCNVYGLSHSGKNTEIIKTHFPFIKDIYTFNTPEFPEKLVFDVVLDAFSDTYFRLLMQRLNFNARYLTCGIFNQSKNKIENVKPVNLSMFIANIMMRNISLIGNCLGNTEDLVNGLAIYKTRKMVLDSVFPKPANCRNL